MAMIGSLMSNPAMLDMMIASNPQMAQMMTPEMRQMMQSEAFRNAMSNPQVIQSIMQLNQSMGGNPLTNPLMGGNPFGGMGGNPLGANPLSALGGLNNPSLSQPTSNEPPEVRFQTQLRQLQDMGFYNAQENVQALTMCNGNVQAAVEFLLRQ
jgi:ubiquilin